MDNIVDYVANSCFCISSEIFMEYRDELESTNNREEQEKIIRRYGGVYDANHNIWLSPEEYYIEYGILELIKEELKNKDYDYSFKESLLEEISNEENPDLIKAQKIIDEEITSIENQCNIYLNGKFNYDLESAAGKEIAEMNRLKTIAKLIERKLEYIEASIRG